MANICMLFNRTIGLAGDLFRNAIYIEAAAHVQGLDVRIARKR